MAKAVTLTPRKGRHAGEAVAGISLGTDNMKGFFKFNTANFSGTELAALVASLTIYPKPSSVAGEKDEDPAPIHCYEFDEKKRYVWLPYYTALTLTHLPFSGRRANKGEPAFFPAIPAPNDDLVEGQTEFFNELVGHVKKKMTCLAQAPTGSGKTVAGVHLMATLKLRTLVIVPNIDLALQWRDEVLKLTGIDPERVAIVGGGSKQDPETASVVIAVINSVILEPFANRCNVDSFGLAIWDEAHRMAARGFSQSLKKIGAKYRLALTATPERKDGCESVIHASFGPVSVRASGKAEPCEYILYHHKCQFKINDYAQNSRDGMLKFIASEQIRNRYICQIVEAEHRRGSQILCLADRVGHLRTIHDMLLERGGITSGDIGFFCGTPLPKKEEAAYLEDVKNNASIILATYGMAKEGFNVPRLNVLVELSPRGDVKQALGRIRRAGGTNRRRVAYSIVDTAFPVAFGMASKRVKELSDDRTVTITRTHTFNFEMIKTKPTRQ